MSKKKKPIEYCHIEEALETLMNGTYRMDREIANLQATNAGLLKRCEKLAKECKRLSTELAIIKDMKNAVKNIYGI